MRGTLFAAVAAFVLLAGAQAQSPVILNESRIQAVLKDEATIVSIPVENTLGSVLYGAVSLEWVNSQDSVVSTTTSQVTLEPGKRDLQIPFRLQQPSIWLRLRYALSPDRADPKAFAPQRGIVALSQIAAHVFEIKVGQIGLAHRGAPYTTQVQAVHPGTRKPVADVRWSAPLHIDNATVPAARVTPREGGFVDLVFQLPPAAHDDPEKEDGDHNVSVDVTGQLGDFVRTETDEIRLPDRSIGRLQTDKPIYQPGQTIHLRALIFDTEGHAAEGAKVTLRIDDPARGGLSNESSIYASLVNRFTYTSFEPMCLARYPRRSMCRPTMRMADPRRRSC